MERFPFTITTSIVHSLIRNISLCKLLFFIILGLKIKSIFFFSDTFFIHSTDQFQHPLRTAHCKIKFLTAHNTHTMHGGRNEIFMDTITSFIFNFSQFGCAVWNCVVEHWVCATKRRSRTAFYSCVTFYFELTFKLILLLFTRRYTVLHLLVSKKLALWISNPSWIKK